MLYGALRAAQFAAMYYKNMFQRPRPSQLWPELMPPIEVPGHASFPSGHATEAAVVALCLNDIAKDGASVVPSADGDQGITTRLAQRIARNREVLGIHYPSDSEAGMFLASTVFEEFMDCATVKRLRTAAIKEWQAFASP
jgi:membrane-associated phospholipid phosphatase